MGIKVKIASLTAPYSNKDCRCRLLVPKISAVKKILLGRPIDLSSFLYQPTGTVERTNVYISADRTIYAVCVLQSLVYWCFYLSGLW